MIAYPHNGRTGRAEEERAEELAANQPIQIESSRFFTAVCRGRER